MELLSVCFLTQFTFWRNSIKLTQNGLEDVEGNHGRMNFVAKMLHNNEYCGHWKDMSDKDKEFFKDFKGSYGVKCIYYGIK